MDKLKRGFNSQEAMAYLGVRRKAFDKYFRPKLIGTKFGTSVIYDRLDLDNILEHYKSRNGRPMLKGESKWAEDKMDSIKTSKACGALTRFTEALDFESVSKAIKKQKTG